MNYKIMNTFWSFCHGFCVADENLETIKTLTSIFQQLVVKFCDCSDILSVFKFEIMSEKHKIIGKHLIGKIHGHKCIIVCFTLNFRY